MKSTRNRSRLADQGTKEMLPVIFSLAWPTMLEQLMQTRVRNLLAQPAAGTTEAKPAPAPAPAPQADTPAAAPQGE